MRASTLSSALLGTMLTLTLLAGCAGQPSPKARPDALAGSFGVDLKAGAAGALRLGMTVDEAVAAMGPSETRPDQLLSWRGGKLCAFLDSGRITRLTISDPAFSLGTLHVGNGLSEAKQLFPTGVLTQRGVGTYDLPPADGKYAWLEVSPTVEESIMTINMTLKPRPQVVESDEAL